MHHPNSFSSRLIRLRAEADMTQKDLSRAAGISVPQIGRYEMGTSVPRMNALIKLAKALHVDVSALSGSDDLAEFPDPKTHAVKLDLSASDIELLQKVANESGKPLQVVLDDILKQGLKLLTDGDPEFTADILRRVEESRNRKRED